MIYFGLEIRLLLHLVRPYRKRDWWMKLLLLLNILLRMIEGVGLPK